MKVPRRDNAYIPAAKLGDYLLSPLHSVGKNKASFFRRLGFHESNIDELEAELLAVVDSGNVIRVVTTEFGVKYVVDGSISTPLGRIVRVRTVWIIEADMDNPRFVTAYPRR